MEKINTPLQMAIEKIQERLEKIQKGTPPTSIHKERQLSRESECRIQIKLLKSLLPKEREVIEKVHNDSIIEFIEALGMEATVEEYRAKDYFTQTFKNT